MNYRAEEARELPGIFDKYDLETLTCLVHLRGKRSHFKFVFPEDSTLENSISIFSVLTKLSHEANVPALFLIKHHNQLVCGIFYNDQLLIMSSYGERVTVRAYESLIKHLFSNSINRPIKKIFISCTSMPQESSDEWVGTICLELIEKFEEMYSLIPGKFQRWGEQLPGQTKNDYWGFSYFYLPIQTVFDENVVQHLSVQGGLLTNHMLRVMAENQRQSVINRLRQEDLQKKKLDSAVNQLGGFGSSGAKLISFDQIKDDCYRAFWQLVIHRLLIDQIHSEKSSDQPRQQFSMHNNPVPFSSVAYSELIKIMREMSKAGSAVIDTLHDEIILVRCDDYSSYDPLCDSWDDDVSVSEDQHALNPKKLSTELAISYTFIGRSRWADIQHRRRTDRLLSDFITGDQAECLLDQENSLHAAKSKLFFVSSAVESQIAGYGGKLLLKQRPDYVECMQPFNDRVAVLKTNFKSYDREITYLFFNSRGNDARFRKFICSDTEEEIARELFLLYQAANEAAMPALFLIQNQNGFICGALFDSQLLWISPFGERDIEQHEALLKRLTSDTRPVAVKSLYIIQERSLWNQYGNSTENFGNVVCLELLAMLGDDIESLAVRMPKWKPDSQENTRSFMGLCYISLRMSDVFIAHPLTECLSRSPLDRSQICELREAQLSWLPTLLYLKNRREAEMTQLTAGQNTPKNWVRQKERIPLLQLIRQEKSRHCRFDIEDLPEPEIFKLIQQGALDKIINYLDLHPEALALVDEKGKGMLHHAVAQSDPTQVRLEIIILLLKRGADYLAMTQDGETLVHIIAKTKNTRDILELVLSHCLSKFFPDDKARVIDQLCNSSKVELQLICGGFLEFVNKRDRAGRTPLDYAIRHGNFEEAECLLIHRATLFDDAAHAHHNPLTYCFFSGAPSDIFKKALSLCLAYSSRENVVNALKNFKDGDGNTLLHQCCKYNELEYLEIFLSLGVKNVVNNNGEFPVQYLPDRSVAALKIKAALSMVGIDEENKKAEPFLSLYECKNRSKYLSRVHGIFRLGKSITFGATDFLDPASLERPPGSPASDAISSPTQFFARGSAKIEGKPLDLPILEVKLSEMLTEIALSVSNLFQAARNLKETDETVYSSRRCLKYLDKYQGFLRLDDNNDFIYNIFTCPLIQLDKHMAYCHLILEELKILSDKSRKNCESVTKQKLLLECKNKITELSLKSVFPSHDINTLRKIIKDKELLDIFLTGVMELLLSHINVEKTNHATFQFFSELKKIVAFIKLVQLIFKLRIASIPAPVDRIFSELRDQILAAIRIQASDDNANQLSSLKEKKSVRW